MKKVGSEYIFGKGRNRVFVAQSVNETDTTWCVHLANGAAAYFATMDEAFDRAEKEVKNPSPGRTYDYAD